MREIKFRAWNKIDKFMWYSDIQLLRILRLYILDLDEYDDLKKENFELMQYTGLKDKNGKEIYEGDIIKRYNKPNCKCETCKNKLDYIMTGYISYDENMACYITIGEDYRNGLAFGNFENEIIEIIGDIYENPEFV